jgi:nucleotide-binding universal stress UspA family protein
MKKNEPKVLACVDRSNYAEHVTDAAAWAATRLAAPLELLHVIEHVVPAGREDHSGTIGINAQETLLNQIASDEAELARDAREQGRAFLARLRARVEAAGVAEPDMRQRYGSLVETLTEQQAAVRLVVMGRRGTSAKQTNRDLGRQVESVIRALDRPILTVTDSFRPPQHVLIAFDGGSAARHAVEMVASSPLFREVPCRLLMVGKGKVGRNETERQLQAAGDSLTAAGMKVTLSHVSGDPETVIARVIQADQMDMLVMGAYTHSPLRAMLLGSKTTELLRASRVPTLLLR